MGCARPCLLNSICRSSSEQVVSRTTWAQWRAYFRALTKRVPGAPFMPTHLGHEWAAHTALRAQPC
jgi:hypothetical protein